MFCTTCFAVSSCRHQRSYRDYGTKSEHSPGPFAQCARCTCMICRQLFFVHVCTCTTGVFVCHTCADAYSVSGKAKSQRELSIEHRGAQNIFASLVYYCCVPDAAHVYASAKHTFMHCTCTLTLAASCNKLSSVLNGTALAMLQRFVMPRCI